MRLYRDRGDWHKRLAIALLAILLLGCSAARMVYNNGEFLSYWWLNGYVDIEPEQQPWVKQRIANLFAWHRKTQLKQYVEFLIDAQKRIDKPVSETELRADYEEGKRRILVIVERALPDLADLALALQSQQIAAMERKFASNNDEYRRENLRGDVEQRQRFRYKKVLKQAETWFGDFSSEQERQIRAASDARPLNNELVLASRMQAQKTLIALLKKIQVERPSREATAAMLKEYVTAALDRFGNPEYHAFYDLYIPATVRMTAAIVNLTTPAQKAHFVKVTQRWIDDFQTLSAP